MKGSGSVSYSLFCAAALVAALVLLPSCAPPPLRIGFVGPLTGSSSAIGLGCRNGFLMAMGKGAVAAPGKLPKLELLAKDDKNDPELCLRAFQELRESGCKIVVLGTPSHAATKAVPWAVEHGMLVITPTISSPLEGDTSGLFLRGSLPSSAFGLALARAAVERFHAFKAGVIGDSRNASYVEALYQGFSEEYGRLGGRPSFLRFFDSSKGEPEAGLVAAIREKGSDALLVIAASGETVLIAKELERARLKVQLLLPPWPLTPDLINDGGAAVEGAFAASTADLSFGSQAGRAFGTAYREEYGEEPSFTAMFGYESGAILRAALATSRSAEPAALRDRILAIGHFDLPVGGISFDPGGKVTRTMFLFTIEDGAFKRIE